MWHETLIRQVPGIEKCNPAEHTGDQRMTVCPFAGGGQRDSSALSSIPRLPSILLIHVGLVTIKYFMSPPNYGTSLSPFTSVADILFYHSPNLTSELLLSTHYPVRSKSSLPMKCQPSASYLSRGTTAIPPLWYPSFLLESKQEMVEQVTFLILSLHGLHLSNFHVALSRVIDINPDYNFSTSIATAFIQKMFTSFQTVINYPWEPPS